MRQWLRSHLTYANVMATIAVFIALGGGTTAVALNGSNTVQSDDLGPGAQVKAADLADNAVNSAEIANGQVKNPDILNGAVTTNKLRDGSVGNADLGPDSVTGAKVLDESLSGADVNDNSLSGADIVESSLGQVPSATLGGLGGDTSSGICNPESGGFITCEQTGTINLARPTRVLIIGQVTATPEAPGGSGSGTCHVGSNVGFLRDSEAFVSVTGGQYASNSMSGVTNIVGPGPIKFGLDCNENSGGIAYILAHLSYVELSPDSP